MKNQFFLSVIVVLTFSVGACSTATVPAANSRKKAEAYRELGVAYMQKNDYTSALREFLKSEQLNPDDAYLHDYIGLTYAAKKRYDLAIQHFIKALSSHPGYTVAKKNLGNVYLYKQKWDTAIDIFKEITKDLIYPTPHFPLSNIGYAYYNKQQYSLAESYYLRALDLAPDFVRAQNGLGKTYMTMGKLDQAVEIFKKAINNAPDTPELYYNLGKVHLMMQNRKKAQNAFRKAMQLSPDSSIGKKATLKYEQLQQTLQW